MSKLTAIDWLSPEKKKRSTSKIPRVTITSKPHKTGPQKKTGPYWRFSVNAPFLEKYFKPDQKIKKISIYVGGQGILFDTRPTKDQPFYEFGKAKYFGDQHLVEQIMKHCAIVQKPNDTTTFHLNAKPFGKFDEKLIHELIYINDENPDSTSLRGLKRKLESDENFPEPDQEDTQTIKIEG